MKLSYVCKTLLMTAQLITTPVFFVTLLDWKTYYAICIYNSVSHLYE